MSDKIEVRQHIVFSGQDNYKLACGAQLVEAPNGDLLCTWLSGSDNEPSNDNCVLISRSTDAGKTWSKASQLLPAAEANSLLSCIYTTRDGVIIAYGAKWPGDKEYTELHNFRIESADSGHTWSEPVPLAVHDNHGSILRKLDLQSGDTLFLVSFSDPRKKPLVGPMRKLCDAASEQDALQVPAEEGIPSGGKFATHIHGCSVLVASDDINEEWTECAYIANRPLGLLEPTAVQLNDGRVVMLMRAEWDGCLWRSESFDNGRTWSQAVATDIPNPSTYAQLIRLADGRIALLNNPIGEKGVAGVRNPLSIWISDDEMESWSVKKDIIATADNKRASLYPEGLDYLAYPFSLVLSDGRLVFVYDRNRRDTIFVEVDVD